MSQSIKSDHISESSVVRVAGNIASGYVAANAQQGFIWPDEAIAEWSVRQARAIVAEVKRTAPDPSEKG